MRNDFHSPKSFDPAAYSYVGTFVINPGGSEASEAFAECVADELLSAFGSVSDVFYSIEGLHKLIDEGGYVGNFVNKHTCDHCGTRFNYGAAFKHEPSGEVIAVGHVCARKSFGADSRRDYDYKRAVAAIKAARERAEGLDYLEANGLSTVLDADHAKRHHILADLRRKAIKWKGLSEKQIALAHKIATEIDTPDTCDFCGETGHKDRNCPNLGELPSEGRHKGLEGTILHARIEDSPYGYNAISYKWLVRFDNGSKVWGSLPSDVADEVDNLKDLHGKRVRFNATIARKERSFGIAKNPRSAELVYSDADKAAHEEAALRLLTVEGASDAADDAFTEAKENDLCTRACVRAALRNYYFSEDHPGVVRSPVLTKAVDLYLSGSK